MSLSVFFTDQVQTVRKPSLTSYGYVSTVTLLASATISCSTNEPVLKSQTTGIPMKYFYMILPIAFSLMMIRIIWNNYERLFKGATNEDPEVKELRKMMAQNRRSSRHRE